MSAAPAAIHAVPYLLLGESRQRQLQERLSELVMQWHRTWAPERSTQPSVQLGPEGEAQTVRGEAWTYRVLSGADTLMQICVRADLLRILCGVGAGEGVFAAGFAPAPASLAAELTQQILLALGQQVVRAALPAAECTVQRLVGTNCPDIVSGVRILSVFMSADRSRPTALLTLSPTLTDALLGARPGPALREPMVGRRQASSEQLIRLRAVLGVATVSWQELNALSVGDVIVLDQALSAPCSLMAGDEREIADVALGQMDNVMAAQVTRLRGAPLAREMPK
ncbi:MAG TPA: FliM/FliN family flagellar motor C-terminal domain-containing protein [Steroidobacteraceae bacterium]|jgi:hypothetical protein|nr:FliM/FliN family flagellar motor C-terminal domain-containing protein [Steroidobacteraceae bacterium]